MVKNIVLIILLFVFGFSCTNQNIFVGKIYSCKNSYKEQSFVFIDKNFCIYKQYFLCDVDCQYKNYEILCKYRQHKNKLELKAIYPIDSILMNDGFIKIPESALAKCEIMNEYSEILRMPQSIGVSNVSRYSKYKNSSYIGYINYINKDDLFYFDNILINIKSLSFNDSITVGISDVFILDGIKIDSINLKQKVNKFLLKLCENNYEYR